MEAPESKQHHVVIAGLDCALKAAYTNFLVQNGAAASKQQHLLTPWVADTCRYRIYDPNGASFFSAAFNSSGTLLATSTTTGFIHLIGIHTRCCFASLDTCLNRGEHTAASYIRVEHLEFFHLDRKLTCISDVYLLVYDLTSLFKPKELFRLNVMDIYDVLTSRISNKSPEYAEKRECGTTFFETWQPATDSSSDPNNVATLSDDAQPTRCVTATSPPVEELTFDTLLSNSTPSSSSQNTAQAKPSTTKTASSQIVTYYKLLYLRYSTLNDGTPQRNIADFIIMFNIGRFATFPPFRILWDITNNTIIQASLLRPPVLQPLRLSSRKEGVFTAAVFTRKFKNWSFLVNLSNGCEPTGHGEGEVLDTSRRINSHNLIATSFYDNDTIFSLWPLQQDSRIWSVYCVVGSPAGQICLFKLFPMDSFTDCHDAFNVVENQIELGSGGLSPVEILSNSKGTLLLCRSLDRLTLVSVNSKQIQTPRTVASPGAADTLDATPPHEQSINLTVIYTYQEAVQKERFECAAFSQCPSELEAFLFCSGRVTPALNLFTYQPKSETPSLMSRIDLPKTGGFKQVLWSPGSYIWIGLPVKDGCIVLFAPAPLQQTWASMLPRFQYLMRNREIIEAEDEFDDLVWMEDQHLAQPKATPAAPECLKKQFNTTPGPWFTSVVRDTLFAPYPFLSPIYAHPVETRDENDKFKEQEMTFDSKSNLVATLTSARLSQLRFRLNTVKRKEQSSNGWDTVNTNDVLWLVSPDVYRNYYRNVFLDTRK